MAWDSIIQCCIAALIDGLSYRVVQVRYIHAIQSHPPASARNAAMARMRHCSTIKAQS